MSPESHGSYSRYLPYGSQRFILICRGHFFLGVPAEFSIMSFRMADVFFKVDEKEFQLRLPDMTREQFLPQPHLDFGRFVVDTNQTNLHRKVLALFLPHTRTGFLDMCKYLYPKVTRVEWLPELVSYWSVIRQEDYHNYIRRVVNFHQNNERIWLIDETAFVNIHSVPAQVAASPELLEAIAVEVAYNDCLQIRWD